VTSRIPSSKGRRSMGGVLTFLVLVEKKGPRRSWSSHSVIGMHECCGHDGLGRILKFSILQRGIKITKERVLNAIIFVKTKGCEIRSYVLILNNLVRGNID